MPHKSGWRADLGMRLLGSPHPERVGHAHKIGEAPRRHLLHHGAAIGLHRDLAQAKLEGDLPQCRPVAEARRLW